MLPASPAAGMELHTLLVPLDGTPLAELALPPAVRLATAAEAEIVLVRVVGAPERASEAGDYLQATVAVLASKGVAVSMAVRQGEPAEEILAEGRQRGVHLVLMATHARSGRDRWVAGSVAETVLKRSPVPVLLARATPEPSGSVLLGEHPVMLVPLDGSTFSESAVGVARGLAELLGGELVLLQAVTEWDQVVVANIPIRSASSSLDAARQQALGYLASVADQVVAEWGGTRPRLVVGEGHPAAAIAGVAAEEGVSLIVMATHGQTALVRDQPGSNAAATLRQTTVPLLLVRPVIGLPTGGQ
jgi:nucleotide-binding universal stress UspA family protein